MWKDIQKMGSYSFAKNIRKKQTGWWFGIELIDVLFMLSMEFENKHQRRDNKKHKQTSNTYNPQKKTNIKQIRQPYKRKITETKT